MAAIMLVILCASCAKSPHSGKAATPSPILGMPSSNPSAKDAEQEVKELRSGVRQNPSNAQKRRMLALALYSIKDLQGAIGEMLAASRLDPQNPLHHYLLGRLYEDHGQSRPALGAYRAAVTLAGKSSTEKEWRPIYSYSLAQMLAKTGDARQAEQRYELALAQLSAYAPEWTASGMDKRMRSGTLGDYLRNSIAKGLSRVRSDLSGTRPSAKEIQAQLSPIEVPVLSRAATPSQELLDLQRRVREGSLMGSDVHVSLGDLYVHSGQIAEGVVEYLAAIDLEQGDSMAWYQLGFAYLGQRRLSDAADAFQRAAELGDSGSRELAMRVRQAIKHLH